MSLSPGLKISRIKMPFLVTSLIQMPGDWIDQIATSSVPLFSSLATPVFWLVGVGIVSLVISLLLGVGRR